MIPGRALKKLKRPFKRKSNTMNINIANTIMEPTPAGRSKTAGPGGREGSFLAMLGKARSANIHKMMFNQSGRFQSDGKETSADFQTCLSGSRQVSAKMKIPDGF